MDSNNQITIKRIITFCVICIIFIIMIYKVIYDRIPDSLINTHQHAIDSLAKVIKTKEDSIKYSQAKVVIFQDSILSLQQHIATNQEKIKNIQDNANRQISALSRISDDSLTKLFTARYTH